MSAHTPGRYAVRSLSPAYWYVADTIDAKEHRCRALVRGPFGSKVDAEKARAAIAKATGSAT